MVSIVALAFLSQARISETVTFQVEGKERTALVFRPAVTTDDPPVVFMFHGHGGGSRQVATQHRIHLAWPEAAVVYPQGLPGRKGKTDPGGVRTGWQGAPGELDDRDIKFFDEMNSWAKKEFHSSPERTFVTGHSNGSLMTWVLQATRGDQAAAFAGLCAPPGLWFRNAPERPMFIIAGTQDELVPIRGMRLFVNMTVKRFGAGAPTEKGDGTQKYEGPQPLWVWIYEGPHKPPTDSGARVVEFFKSVL